MPVELEKAQIMFKLTRKGNWGNCYDRLEHFKRFASLDQSVKELSKIGWLLMHKKGKFIGISLNPQFKKGIIEFIEKEMPHLKGVIR